MKINMLYNRICKPIVNWVLILLASMVFIRIVLFFLYKGWLNWFFLLFFGDLIKDMPFPCK